MPRGVLQGEPEVLGAPPYHRRPGDLGLVLARDLTTGAAVPAAMRWGLSVPSDPRRRTLQVRADQLSGRRIARRPRCLVPIGGYVQRSARQTRIGVTVIGDMSLAIAAVWSSEIGGPAFAIVTTEPNEVLSPVHARMPVLLPPALWTRWLDERPLEQADLVLIDRPAPSAWLRAGALPRRAEQGPSLSVLRQLEAWAPGVSLWNPRDRERQDTAAVEVRHAVG